MSIINDALKKTQSNLDENTKNKTTPDGPGAPATPPTPEKTPPPSAPASSGNKRTIAILLFLMLLILVGGFAIKLLYDRGAPVPTAPQSQAKPAAKQEKSKTLPPSNASQDVSGISLNGTIMIDNKRGALLNGEIYEVGDTINGMTIKSITLEEVTFDNNGQEYVLSTRRRK